MEHPDLFNGLHAGEFEALYRHGFVRVLQGTDRCGRCVVCMRPSNVKDFGVDSLLPRWVQQCVGGWVGRIAQRFPGGVGGMPEAGVHREGEAMRVLLTPTRMPATLPLAAMPP